MKDTWEILAFYESRDLLDRTYKERFRRKPSSSKLAEITYHLAQGREYFSSAKQSALLVRPLLLYYGVLALSRALILFLDYQKRECALQEKHGLKISNGKEVLHKNEKEQGIKQLTELKLKFEEGTFTELSRATKNGEQAEFVWGRLYRLWQRNGTTELEMGYEITVKEVLARIQDIAYLFEATFKERSRCYPAKILGSSEQMFIHVSSELLKENLELPNMVLPSEREIREIFPSLRDAEQDSRGGFKVTGGESCKNIDLPPIRNDRHGSQFLVAPLSNGHVLSSLSFLYLISYATGMLARYYPSQWGLLMHGSKGDWLFPLIKSALSVVEERVPELTLLTLEWARDCDCCG
ncbi:hypothetical protein HYR99_35840 [Candidatus Poribacteria bacterium]|nr:hypothetical protein [Candidatus Poribacteria bacterium]